MMWPVASPGSWVASTKRCKDAGRVRSRATGAPEDAAARRVLAGQGPGERCRYVTNLRLLYAVAAAAAFLLELAALAALAYWGAVSGTGAWAWVLGVLTPLVAAVLWGTFASPRAPVRLPRAPKLALNQHEQDQEQPQKQNQRIQNGRHPRRPLERKQCGALHGDSFVDYGRLESASG